MPLHFPHLFPWLLLLLALCAAGLPLCRRLGGGRLIRLCLLVNLVLLGHQAALSAPGDILGLNSRRANGNVKDFMVPAPGAGTVLRFTGNADDPFRAQPLEVPTAAALRAVSVGGMAANTAVEVRGCHVSGDGGGGTFRYSPASSAADDGAMTLAPSAGTGRWLRLHSGAAYNVLWFGARRDGATDDAPAINATIAAAGAAGAGARVQIPAGTYLYASSIVVRFSNITIAGEGSLSTTLKRKAGSAACPGVELGVLAAGNDAPLFERIAVTGLTIDGNSANVPQPVDDLTDWGLNLTKVSHSRFDDIRAINCWNGGVGIFINSNYNSGNCIVKDCGEGMTNGTREPGFDINSSKYNRFSVISEGCWDGARVLDNCWGNVCDFVIRNARGAGLIYGNQSVNYSYSNILRATVIGGCPNQGVVIGGNCSSTLIHATVQEVTGVGIYEVPMDSAAVRSHGNQYIISTRLCGRESALIGGTDGQWTILSEQDGRSGGQGDLFAVHLLPSAQRNTLSVTVRDSDPWQVRGVSLDAGSAQNQFLTYKWLNTADPWNDQGTGNSFSAGLGLMEIASTSVINLPMTAASFRITGNESIADMTAYRRGVHTLVFSGTLSVVATSEHLRLNGVFRAVPGSTLTLHSDGSTLRETARSAPMGRVVVDGTPTAPGNTGSKTIHAASGSVRFAAAASPSTPLVLTNSLITSTASRVLVTVCTNDTTCRSAVAVVTAAGSASIYPGAAPTAETEVFFLVVN